MRAVLAVVDAEPRSNVSLIFVISKSIILSENWVESPVPIGRLFSIVK